MSEKTDENRHESETHVAIEVMGMMPRMRDELRISVQAYAGETCYVIEDAISSKFYRLGMAEYTFVSMLDGKTTIAEAMGHNASVMGASALSQSETGSLCKWLLDSGLATTSQSSGAARLSQTRGKEVQRKLVSKTNPLMQKLPLFNPMPLLRPIDAISRAVFSRLGACMWLLVVGFGGYKLWADRSSFATATDGVMAENNWMWLIATWVGLKLIHELSHAMACRRYGGIVREAGIVFVVFAPMPYVDVTSSWRIDSKWKRILIAAAGMYAEIFLAAVAAIVWSNTFDPVVKQHCVNVIVTATLVTLMFNANPLMRFDGYYMLTDAVEMPNLATHGRQWVSYFMRRYFMGVKVSCPTWPEGKHWAVVSYAILAFLWRILISVSIALAAEVLFHGAGVVLAAIAVALWIAVPAYKTITTLRETSNASYPRMATITGVVAAILIAMWTVIPWYSHTNVPVVVDYHPTQEIRCGVNGFLTKCFAKVGDRVHQGDVLATLSNRELELEAENLELEWEQSRQRERDYRHDGEIAAVQVERRIQESIEYRIDQVVAQTEALTIVAPADGIIASNEIDSQEGTVVRAGDRLMVLGADNREMIYGLVQQSQIDAVRQHKGTSLRVHIWGSGMDSFEGKIARVLPRASNALKHEALGAHAGGPLTVQPARQSQDDQTTQMELLEPHFPVLIDFAGCDVENVRPGQCGYARLSYRDGTVGEVISYKIRRWIHRKRQQMNLATQTAQAQSKQIQNAPNLDHPPSRW